MDRKELMGVIGENQRRVERLLSAVRMDAREGVSAFESRANDLAEALFMLQERRDLKLVSLRAQATKLIKQASQLIADYMEFDKDPDKYLQEQIERAEKVEKRGGKRAGSGRPSLGVKKPVMITLPQEDWNMIDARIAAGEYKGYADYFRSLHSKAH